jgi:hypothetical protein
MRRYKKREITDQMLYDVLIDHKNRSYKQISEILEEIELRGLPVVQSLREDISKNVKNCPSCQKEMKNLDYVEISLREIKYDFFICANCYSDIKKIDKKIRINQFEGHELYELLDKFKKRFEDDDDFFFGKSYNKQ